MSWLKKLNYICETFWRRVEDYFPLIFTISVVFLITLMGFGIISSGVFK